MLLMLRDYGRWQESSGNRWPKTFFVGREKDESGGSVALFLYNTRAPGSGRKISHAKLAKDAKKENAGIYSEAFASCAELST